MRTDEESRDWLEMLLNLMPQTGIFRIGGNLGDANDSNEIFDRSAATN